MSEHSERIRASDAEREEVAAALRQAMSEGRLTLAEGEQRLAEVYATVYRDELPQFVTDLPPTEPSTGPGRQRGGGGREAGARRRRPPKAGLLVAAAVAVGIWAVAGSGPVWLAIVLGVFALLSVKHAACGHRERHPHERDRHRHHRHHASDRADHAPAGG